MPHLAQLHAAPHRAFDALPDDFRFCVFLVIAVSAAAIGYAAYGLLILSRAFYLYAPASRRTD